MKVEMLTMMAGLHPATKKQMTARPGQLIDLPTQFAKDLISGGYAVDPNAKEKSASGTSGKDSSSK